ncbi:MAG: P-loop NTPase fold protein [Planctomycetota bacterium]|nr:P-loop NTPase fold protein [Planctomycetota bacterium]
MSAPLNLIPDAPIADATFDRLDRMAFVRSFAEAIRAAKGENSVVLALAGPWGSGKSSLLNLIAGELEGNETEKSPLLVRFNPWWFTETKQLIAAFLQQLGAAVKREEVVDVLGDAAAALDDLADALAAPGEFQGKDLVSRDIQLVREKVVDVFRRSDRRILIFLDDIDRLSPEEMSQLLLIVRAIADFPHTTYVLSFDYDVVVEAMANKLGVDGRTYLEKVVQLQIDVPLPTRMSLERMVIGQLAEIDPEAQGLDEESRTVFRMIFEGGIRHFLATPRACTRFLNVVRFIYPTVKGNVFVPDMLGLSALMAFSSQAIQAIRSFQDAFVGHCDERGRGWVELSSFHEKWLSRIPARDRSYVEAIVRILFPKVAWALNGPLQGESYCRVWDERQRICSPRHFDTYFRLGLSAGEATEYQWQNLVELLDDATSFARALNQFGPISDEKAESWIMDLLQQASEFISEKANPDQAERMFQALMKRGDQVDIFEEDPDPRLIEPIHRVVSLLVECLQRMASSEQRVQIVKQSLSTDASIFTATELMELLEHRVDLFAAKGEQLDARTRDSRLMDLVKALDSRIQRASEDGTLAQHPRMIRILKKWHRYGRKNRVQQWLAGHCQDDQVLVATLLSITSDKSLLTESDRARQTNLPLELIGALFDTPVLLERANAIFEDEPDWIPLEGELLLSSLADLLAGPTSRS